MNELTDSQLKEGFETNYAAGFLIIPYLMLFCIPEIVEKLGIKRNGISVLKMLMVLVNMRFFGTKRISYLNALNNSEDRGFALLCGISKVVDSSLMYRFRDIITQDQIDCFTTEIGKRATALGLIIGSILNIDTHTSPFYGQAEAKKTKIGSKNKVMKAIVTLFVQDQETQRMIYHTSNFKNMRLGLMLPPLLKKIEKITGKMPEHLLFDLGFWNGVVFKYLDHMDVKFTTLYKQYPKNLMNIKKIMITNPFKPIKFTALTRKRLKAFIIDTKTNCISGYNGRELRIIVMKIKWKRKWKIVTFLTNDFFSSGVEIIERYSKRWRIENWFSESMDHLHLDALSSPKPKDHDLLSACRVLIDDTMTLLKYDASKKFANMGNNRFFREVLGNGKLKAHIQLHGDTIVVRFKPFNKQYVLEPLFENINEKLENIEIDQRIPWLNNHKIKIEFEK